MATETDIHSAFKRIRELIAQSATAKQANRRSDMEFAELVQISAFLLEGFLIDLHRIADAQKRLADATTLPDLDESGWTKK